MKEATGELSTTMIAVVAIAAVLTIFTVILLPYLKSQISARMHCTDAVCDCTESEKICDCTWISVTDTGSEETHDVKCQNPDYQKTATP